MTELYYKLKMNKPTWFIILAWPAVMAWLHVPFFYAMIPGYLIAAISIIIDLKDKNIHGSLKTIGGLVCLFAIWSFIFAVCGGEPGGCDVDFMGGFD